MVRLNLNRLNPTATAYTQHINHAVHDRHEGQHDDAMDELRLKRRQAARAIADMQLASNAGAQLSNEVTIKVVKRARVIPRLMANSNWRLIRAMVPNLVTESEIGDAQHPESGHGRHRGHPVVSAKTPRYKVVEVTTGHKLTQTAPYMTEYQDTLGKFPNDQTTTRNNTLIVENGGRDRSWVGGVDAWTPPGLRTTADHPGVVYVSRGDDRRHRRHRFGGFEQQAGNDALRYRSDVRNALGPEAIQATADWLGGVATAATEALRTHPDYARTRLPAHQGDTPPSTAADTPFRGDPAGVYRYNPVGPINTDPTARVPDPAGPPGATMPDPDRPYVTRFT